MQDSYVVKFWQLGCEHFGEKFGFKNNAVSRYNELVKSNNWDYVVLFKNNLMIVSWDASCK